MERLIGTTVSRQRPVRKNVTNLVASFLAFVLAGCAEMKLNEYKAFEGNKYSRLHADFVPVNSLRLAQVQSLGTREEIQDARDLGNLTIYQKLIAADITDEEIRDGSVGIGEVVCCGGPPSKDTWILFYVSPNMDVGVGDIVEIRAGALQEGNSDAYPNVVTLLRQKRGTAAGCRWLPENPRLWMRTLYCSGIDDEGWIQQGGIWKFWYKPPPS